jgi:hypothetical protein
MRKLGLLAMLAAFGMLAVGCIVTDYPVITDNVGNNAGFVVGTNGDAVIYTNTTGQGMIGMPYGWVEAVNHVDQQSDGDQWLLAHANISTGAGVFYGYTYCNTDVVGCWMTRVWNPVAGDVSIFDYDAHNNCPGNDAVSIMASYFGRPGECGSSTGSVFGNMLEGTGVSDQGFLDLVGRGVPEGDFLRYDLNADTFQLALVSGGDRYPLDIAGNLSVLFNPAKRQLKVDLTSVKSYPFVEAWVTATDLLRADQGPGAAFSLEGNLLGTSFTSHDHYQLALRPGWNGQELLATLATGTELPTRHLRTDRR